MRGQKHLVEMRMRRHVPDCVWIDTDPASRVTQADDWLAVNNTQAHLHLDAEDKPRRLDLRCVRGLTCYVDGSALATVRAVRDACIDVGAARVIATTMDRIGSGEFVAFRVSEMTDTQGVFTHG